MRRHIRMTQTSTGVNPAESAPAGMLVPDIAREDLVEQLLLEYRDAPNPDKMQYIFESGPESWRCACGSRNADDENFCGYCGVSRIWLEEHTSANYLAAAIRARKGAAAVNWRTAQQEPVEVQTALHDPAPSGAAKAESSKAATHLAGYADSRLMKLLHYTGTYGTWKRRLIAVFLVVLILALLAVLFVWLADNF